MYKYNWLQYKAYALSGYKEMCRPMEKPNVILFQEHHNVIPDEIDKKIVIDRIAQWDRCQGPRVGDYAIMPDGSMERFAHNWGDSLQTTSGGFFYLGNGYMSMSGGLHSAIPKTRIRDASDTKMGICWIFHHDYREAFRSVGAQVPCRVYQILPAGGA